MAEGGEEPQWRRDPHHPRGPAPPRGLRGPPAREPGSSPPTPPKQSWVVGVPWPLTPSVHGFLYPNFQLLQEVFGVQQVGCSRDGWPALHACAHVSSRRGHPLRRTCWLCPVQCCSALPGAGGLGSPRAGEQQSRDKSWSNSGVHTPHHSMDPIHCAEWKTDHTLYRTQPLPLYARW